MDLEKLKYLAGVESMSWKVNQVEHAICEGKGPLVLRLHDEVVKQYPWHCVPHPNWNKPGELIIRDMLKHGRVIAIHEPGSYDLVQHEPKFRVIQLPRPGDRI